jgi:phosphatidylinositol glycan class B
MSRRGVNIALGAIVLLGLVLRALALRYEPAHHPDEFFQYLEPAWGRLTGVGIETWEWRSGVRSWVLPGYHGAWMAILMKLGVHEGSVIGKILQAHWALLSMSLVWAGWRGGVLLARRSAWGQDPAQDLGQASSDKAAPAGWQGGLVGALWCAAFPLQVRFSIHTLSEEASILCMVCALVLTAELVHAPRRKDRWRAVWMGLLLGLGFCLRIQHAPVPLLVLVWLLFARRFSLAAVAYAASLLPILMFGVVDRLTWGGWFASYISYVKFNLIEGGASMFGTSPWKWYWTQFSGRLPIGLPILGLLCLLGIRRAWPFVLSALGLAVLLSTQAHKEERFLMLFWPLALIAAAAGAGTWLARRPAEVRIEGALLRPRRWRTWVVRIAILAAIPVVLADGARHCRGNDFTGLWPSRYEAQVWAGRQADMRGLFVDLSLYTGGYMWFSRSFPQLHFEAKLLGNPLFSHVLVPRDSGERREAERAGFTEVFSKDEMMVLRRPPPPTDP